MTNHKCFLSTGEGTIEVDEFTAVNVKYGASADDCAEAFKRISKVRCILIRSFKMKFVINRWSALAQNNPVVTSTVFAQLWTEFFTSDDPNVPGTFIFGRLSF